MMLKSRLLHPEILSALASNGHGSKVLIADSNYPFVTHSGPNADVVFLNLAPGLISATEVLDVLADSVPIEAAEVMVPDSGPEPSIFAEFRSILGDVELRAHGRFDFYEAATAADVCLAIATGEQRIYANVLLTLGVIKPA